MAVHPEKMRAVVLEKALVGLHDEEEVRSTIQIKEVPVPKPKPGQVLVKVAYSTINPSDVAYLHGVYGKPLCLPCTDAGFEGCGEVVSSGGGFLGWKLLGKRVSFYGGGAWSEYVVVPATRCIVLPAKAELKNCTSAFVNPLTVLAILDVVMARGLNALVHTGAAGALGRQLIRAGKQVGVKVICVVRRGTQVDICKSEGAEYVFDSSTETFEADLKACCKKLNCKLAFDCVGGETTSTVLGALVPGGTVHVYGGMSGKFYAQGSLKDIIFQDKTVTGFFLTKYLQTKSVFTLIRWTRKVASQLTTVLSTTYSRDYSLDEIPDALLQQSKGSSDGKPRLHISALKT